MGDSLRVYSPVLAEFVVADFLSEIERIANILLHHPVDFRLDLVLLSNHSNVEKSVGVDGGLHTIWERNILKEGIHFYYEFDKNWSLHSDVPMFEFVVVEIPRRDDDIRLLLSLSIAVAAALILSASHIIDGNGVWSVDFETDSIELQELLNMANDSTLPLEEALQTFYKKLPAFR